MGKSYLLFAALVAIVYCVNGASLPHDFQPSAQKLPHPEDPPKFASLAKSKRNARGYGYDEDHEDDHERHHSEHDEHFAEHHEHDFDEHHQHGHADHYGHHDEEYDHHEPYHGHNEEHYPEHEHEHEHEYGHHDHEHDEEHDHDHHEHHHVDEDEDDDDVESAVHIGHFNKQQASSLQKKENSQFENVKEVKYEVEKTNFNSQSALNLEQQQQFDAFAFDSQSQGRNTNQAAQNIRYTDTPRGNRRASSGTLGATAARN